MNKITPKGWGYEHTLVNNDKYCGKLLFFVKGHKCSFHAHAVKDETFYIQSGKIELLYFDDPKEAEKILKSEDADHFLNYYCNKVILSKGDTFHVPPGRIHQMIAIEDTELFEFSTTDKPEDSYRLIKGD